MKVCFKCKNKKELKEFSKDKTTKTGYNAKCRNCCKEYMEKRNKLPEFIKLKEEYYHNNKEKIKKTHQNYRSKPEIKLYHKKYSKEYNKEYYKNPEIKEKQKEYVKNYNLKPENKQNRKNRHKERWKTDPLYKLIKLMRGRLYQILGSKRSKRVTKILGCNHDELKHHFEKQWESWMNWDNWGFGEGKWVVDHIIPLASAKTEEDIYKLSHYTNLRPLEWRENLIKKDNII
jgi:hypothetical protein